MTSKHMDSQCDEIPMMESFDDFETFDTIMSKTTKKQQDDEKWIHTAMRYPNFWVIDPQYSPYTGMAYHEYVYFTINPNTAPTLQNANGLYVHLVSAQKTNVRSHVTTGRWERFLTGWRGYPELGRSGITSIETNKFYVDRKGRDVFDFAINDPRLNLSFLATRPLCEKSSKKRIDRILEEYLIMNGH